MPPKIHLDPLLIVDDSEPRQQASAGSSTTHGASSPPTLVRSKVGQNSVSKKEEPSAIKHQDGVPSIVPTASTLNDLPTLAIAVTCFQNDSQNTPPENVLVITINDTSSGSSKGHCTVFEDAPNVVLVNPSDFVVT